MPKQTPSQDTSASLPKLRLCRILKQHKEEIGYKRLLAAINEANPGAKGSRDGTNVIHRHKVRQIVEARGDLAFRVSEFVAIDRYLEKHREGLSYRPLFDRPEFLGTLADTGRVTFLVGAKPEPESLRVVLDHCDVRAVSEAERAINSIASTVRLETQDIEHHDDVGAARAGMKTPTWKQLSGKNGPSLVSFASSRANLATEWMLSKMFKVPAFTTASASVRKRIPFQFCWKPGLARHASAFHHEPSQGEHLPDASSILVDGETFTDQISERGYGETFGVCVAQRRSLNQLWVVCAGITGLATFACAQALDKIGAHLAQASGAGHSPIYLALIGAELASEPSRSLESLRELGPAEIRWQPDAIEPVGASRG